jgi:glutathione S-transferase
MRLVVANKNYSSWSMRAWMLLTQLEIPFEEVKLSFNDPQFKARVAAFSPARRVPVLIDGDLVVWDSLAIAEYVAERFPERGVWPSDAAARARARSVCAEMHAGFGALRDRLPMNCELHVTGMTFDRPVKRDIARIVASWTDCRARFGGGGPFLFGAFSAADAYYAPVVRRFLGFDVELPEAARAYAAAVDALPSMRRWMADALAEHDYFDEDEPYRETRDPQGVPHPPR